MGFTEDAIKQELEWDAPDVFEVWPEHLPALNLFLAVQNRWVFPALGGKPIGLDCEWVKFKAELMFPRKRRRKIVAQLELIEAGALSAWRSKS